MRCSLRSKSGILQLLRNCSVFLSRYRTRLPRLNFLPLSASHSPAVYRRLRVFASLSTRYYAKFSLHELFSFSDCRIVVRRIDANRAVPRSGGNGA